MLCPGLALCAPEPEWRDLDAAGVDRALLHPAAAAVLDDPAHRWRHAAAGPFVLHFERQMFATRVARMGVFFHQRIAADFPGLPDTLGGPSHLFLFRDDKDWQAFLQGYAGAPEWSGSLVSGHAMFLLQQDSVSSSGDVLAHEMTHLVFNRILGGRIPLWLNEGLAEWYAVTLYPEFKGIKRSVTGEFRGRKDLLPVAMMWSADVYPSDPETVRRFYHTAKCMAGYLVTEYPREKMEALVRALREGAPTPAAMREVYGYASAEAFDEALQRHVR